MWFLWKLSQITALVEIIGQAHGTDSTFEFLQ